MPVALCERAGCRRAARWIPVLVVPLRGERRTLAVKLALRVCDQHRLSRRAVRVLVDAQVLEAMERAATPGSLDLENARVEHVPVHGMEPGGAVQA